jgi:transposase
MATKMTERDWELAVEVFRACLPRRGAKGRDDRLFLEALHYYTVHNITWRALPERFGHWNAVWKRFSRLSKAGVFEAFFAMLAECSRTAHVVQRRGRDRDRTFYTLELSQHSHGAGPLATCLNLGGSCGPPWWRA